MVQTQPYASACVSFFLTTVCTCCGFFNEIFQLLFRALEFSKCKFSISLIKAWIFLWPKLKKKCTAYISERAFPLWFQRIVRPFHCFNPLGSCQKKKGHHQGWDPVECSKMKKKPYGKRESDSNHWNYTVAGD